MAKTSVSSVVPGRVGDIQRAAAIEADERVAREPASPAPSGNLESLINPELNPPAAEMSAEQTVDAVGAGIQAGIEREIDVEQQRQANIIPPIQERATSTEVQRWGAEPKEMPTSNGGIFARAKQFGAAIEAGSIRPRFGTEAMRAARAEAGNMNQLAAAAESAGALVDNSIDPDYAVMGSIVTENFMARLAEGKEEEGASDAVAEALGEQRSPAPATKGQNKITKAAQNERLGQDIHAEYMRMKNRREGRDPDQYEKLPSEQAVTLGDAMKEMWAAQNPDLVQRFTTPGGGQTYFQLTDEGASLMAQSAEIRKRMFPTLNVRPAKSVPERGRLAGDVGRQVKPWSGKVGSPEGSQVLKRAAENMSKIPNVVDTQRAKILFSTFLPVLAGQQMDPSLTEAYSEINNVGPSKIRQYAAAKKDQDRRREEAAKTGQTFREADYDPDQVMTDLIDKVAQEVRSVAQERHGANYLTYSVAAFNGRISPQQTYFDPTSSKAVRFVTRNAVPAMAKKGNRQHKNLQQMYAMMLVKGADAKLPRERVTMLENASPQLYQWGQRLKQALDETMTDAEYEAIADAIAEGKPLSQIPFKPLALDPQADAELIAAIKKKGEDGPHFIDGLIDFVGFTDAMNAGRPYPSYFNAYMDGKTNGLASNGIQMGHEPTAAATGVLRESKTDLLDDGDIRDKLKTELLDLIENGWDGELDEIKIELNDVAQAVYSWRDLNKATTMTFGYGKEISSFAKDIETTIGELNEIANSGDAALIEEHNLGSFSSSLEALEVALQNDEKSSRKLLSEILLGKYAVGLEQALSEDALKGRTLMRSAAFLHAITDTLFSINSVTGFDLHLGKNVSEGSRTAKAHGYSLEVGGKKTSDIQALEYQTRPTSAAARGRMDREGNIENIPGEYAHGGSLPGPVQSLDAATVALTVTGDSWRRLNAQSGGNPYIHTIYDAFKADANGFDVMFEEVNKNWLNSAMEWSYLEKTKDSLQVNLQEFNQAYKSDDPYRQLTPEEAELMNYFLDPAASNSGKFPSRLLKKVRTLVDKLDGEDAEGFEDRTFEITKNIWNPIRKMGFKPGENVTAGMRYIFYRQMADALAVSHRLNGMIERTNNNKKKLKQKIREKAPSKAETLGYDFSHGAQYYAH